MLKLAAGTAALAVAATLACAQPAPGVLPRPERQDSLPGAAPAPPIRLDELPRDAVPALARPVEVRGFRISGLDSAAHARMEAGLRDVLAPWTGRLVQGAEFQQAAAAVAAFLRTKGFLLAQAGVPQQDAADGIVDLVVLPGRIGEVRVASPPGPAVRESVVARFLEALAPGAEIRRDNLEHGLLVLNDLPGVRVAASLSPGSRPGIADVNVAIEEDAPFAGSLALDNAGLRSTGEYRADASLRWRSPLALGDLLALRLMRSNTGGQRLASLTYGWPLNGLGTRMGVRMTQQRYRLGGEFAALEGHGRHRSWSLLASHPWLRRSDHNLALAFAYTDHASSDRLDAVGFENDTRQRLATAGLAGDFRDRVLGEALTAWQLQWTAGHLALHTPGQAAFDAGPGGLGMQGSFGVLRFRLQRDQLLRPGTVLRFAVHGQRSTKNLEGANELAVGGPQGVRAYPQGELHADEGVIARIELHQLVWQEGAARSAAFGFLDGARVRVNHIPLPSDTANLRSFGGYGAGLSHDWNATLSLEASLAWRNSRAPAAEPDRRPRAWLALIGRF